MVAGLVCSCICRAQDAATPSEAPNAPPHAAPSIFDTSHCKAMGAGDPQLSPLAAVCEFALSFRRQLPDFVCEETVKNGLTGVMNEEVTFGKHGEQYSHVTINGKPVDATVARMTFTSWGEFGTDLANLFRPPIVAEFRFRKEATLRKNPSSVYEFHVAAQKNNFWVLRGNGARLLHPEYGGELWLDRRGVRVNRLALRSMHLPKDFEFDEVAVTIDYSEVPIEGLGAFLLPSRSVTKVCYRTGGGPNCTENASIFHDCRKFATKSRIVTDTVSH